MCSFGISILSWNIALIALGFSFHIVILACVLPRFLQILISFTEHTNNLRSPSTFIFSMALASVKRFIISSLTRKNLLFYLSASSSCVLCILVAFSFFITSITSNPPIFYSCIQKHFSFFISVAFPIMAHYILS